MSSLRPGRREAGEQCLDLMKYFIFPVDQEMEFVAQYKILIFLFIQYLLDYR